MHFLEKYVTIKIKDYKILLRMSILSSKLNKVNASYVCKYNSILSCISLYFINLSIFSKNKIKYHKILVLMNKISPKLDEINASYACKNNSTMSDLHVFYQFTT